MAKHKIIHSQIEIDDISLMEASMSKEEVEEYVKTQLVSGLVDEILKGDITTLHRANARHLDNSKFTLSLVVMNYDQYLELSNAIVRNNFNIIKDGEVTPLINLL